MWKFGDRKRVKMQRSLLIELPGLGKPNALERRPYPPGQHGQGRRKFSEFGLRLKEKQKLLFHYGLREEQLRRMVKRAKTGQSSDWMNTLIGMLESRLDNVVFRLGLAPSIAAARQMVTHGHVKLDGKPASIPSQEVRPGQEIALSDAAAANAQYAAARQQPRLLIADYLGLDGGEKPVGRMKSKPSSDHIPFPFDQGLVAEFYSKA